MLTKSATQHQIINKPIPIKRALISVSDKSNLLAIAQTLQKMGCEIISTGGTGRKLEEAGIKITDISSVTGNPEAFGGRMKTISFNIESALLFDREKDAEEAASLGIESIDMVICNLYPFEKVLNANADFDTLIENIDIGGPTMLRAAAKNFKYVSVVTDINDYSEIIKELEESNGTLSLETRHQLMRKTFNHTADYDAIVAMAMDKSAGIDTLRLTFDQAMPLRYGENSHQKAHFYRQKNAEKSLFDIEILHGKALSFNNILDIYGAIEAVRRLENQACSVVKHSNPCGLCEGKDQAEVLRTAWAGDPISAFGSIIAFNQKLEKETVEFFQLDAKNKRERKFIEVIIAPDFDDDALTYLQQHKNLRIIRFDTKQKNTHPDLRYMNGSLLVQDLDEHLYDKLEVVTNQKFDLNQQKALIEFGIKAISNIKSNAIVIVRQKGDNLQLLGMGAGQPNRLIATKLAIEKCKENLTNEYQGDELQNYIETELGQAILISDAFFPFPDNVELAAQYGIKNIVQPGGSIKDKLVIETCNSLNISMVFTGTRHFKH